MSVDPLTGSYPELTPYQFASNTPIWAIDLDGLEAYFTNTGHFSHWGKNKSQSAPVILVTKSGEIKIPLNYMQMLDRAHWIFGEGGGNFADYYAHTMQNQKEWGYHGEGFTESELYKSMNDGTFSGKDQFFSGNTGLDPYDKFSEARSGKDGLDPSGLTQLKGASTSILAVLNEQAGLTSDPTFGTTNWFGDPKGSDFYENKAKKRAREAGSDHVLTRNAPDGRTHIFYDWRHQNDLDRRGLTRPYWKKTPLFKMDSSIFKLPQFEKLPSMPLIDYLKTITKERNPRP